MRPRGSARPVKFAGSQLGESRHICAFFATTEDEYRTILPFTQDGLAAGERVVHVMSLKRTDHAERLKEAGIDVGAASDNRQLQLLVSEQLYLSAGRFDGDAMLDLIQRVLASGYDLGFPLTRLVAHAENVMKDEDSTNAFLEYESRLSYVLPRYADPVICTYDLNLVSSGVAMDVLRTHPTAIIGGILQQNPFYVPPDEFLREMDRRRTNGSLGFHDSRRHRTADGR
jgi:hypothetical protein